MDENEKYQLLQEWLSVIYSDIQKLLINRYIFNEIREIIKANPGIQIGSAFYDWIGIVYPESMSIGIRRQLDNRKDSISLVRLLKKIINCPEVLSRERYLKLYENSSLPIDIPNKEFDHFSGKIGDHVDPKIVQQDLDKLEEMAKKIKNFATKRVAHFDQHDFEDFPTFGELDEVLNYLEEVLQKYRLLLQATGGDIIPSFNYDWKMIFRKPWIEQLAK